MSACACVAPSVQGCLGLAAGEIVCVTDGSREDWWFGYLHRDAELSGAFPAGFVAPYEAEAEAPDAAEEAAEPEAAAAATADAVDDESAAVTPAQRPAPSSILRLLRFFGSFGDFGSRWAESSRQV